MALPFVGQTVYVVEALSHRVAEGEIHSLNYPNVAVYSNAWLCTTRNHRWGIDCFESRERAEAARRNFICSQIQEMQAEIQELQAQIDELRATL